MHIPKKRFGQNFLVDESIIQAIVRAISPMPKDRMIEIGPGLGALTRPLLQSLDHLHVVEIDRSIVQHLLATFPPEKLTIHECDALRFDFSGIGDKVRVVGNLPYNISTPLLFHLASFGTHIADMHFMLQKEVVDRMIAEPSTHDYGRLSVMLQQRFAMEKLFEVPPSAFKPAPKVDSAIVRMVPYNVSPYQVSNMELFSRIVSDAFMHRRKTLRNSLGSHLTTDDFASVGIEGGLRAENLSVADYAKICAYLDSRG